MISSGHNELPWLHEDWENKSLVQKIKALSRKNIFGQNIFFRAVSSNNVNEDWDNVLKGFAELDKIEKKKFDSKWHYLWYAKKKSYFLRKPDVRGYTLLHYAVSKSVEAHNEENKRALVISYLLEAGVDVNKKSRASGASGKSALEQAIESQDRIFLEAVLSFCDSRPPNRKKKLIKCQVEEALKDLPSHTYDSIGLKKNHEAWPLLTIDQRIKDIKEVIQKRPLQLNDQASKNKFLNDFYEIFLTKDNDYAIIEFLEYFSSKEYIYYSVIGIIASNELKNLKNDEIRSINPLFKFYIRKSDLAEPLGFSIDKQSVETLVEELQSLVNLLKDFNQKIENISKQEKPVRTRETMDPLSYKKHIAKAIISLGIKIRNRTDAKSPFSNLSKDDKSLLGVLFEELDWSDDKDTRNWLTSLNEETKTFSDLRMSRSESLTRSDPKI